MSTQLYPAMTMASTGSYLLFVVLLLQLQSSTADVRVPLRLQSRKCRSTLNSKVKIWYLEKEDLNDFGSLYQQDESKLLTAEFLQKETGLQIWEIEVSTADNNPLFQSLKTDRKWESEDSVTLTGPDDVHGKKFWSEHFHDIEAVRYITEGVAVWDVRDRRDKYIRVRAQLGLLLVLPAGLYHRFVVPGGPFTCKRLFSGDKPKWTAFYRKDNHDNHPARLTYLSQFPSAAQFPNNAGIRSCTVSGFTGIVVLIWTIRLWS